MAFCGPIEDRLAIRELYGSYADAAFSGNGEAWLECWADGGVWDTPAGKAEGWASLIAQWDGLWSAIETMAFFAEITLIEADGDCARGRAYCREISRWKDGSMVKVIGRYEDDIVRTGGAWRFARRTFAIHLSETTE